MKPKEQRAEEHAEWTGEFFKWVYKEAFIHGYKHGFKDALEIKKEEWEKIISRLELLGEKEIHMVHGKDAKEETKGLVRILRRRLETLEQ